MRGDYPLVCDHPFYTSQQHTVLGTQNYEYMVCRFTMKRRSCMRLERNDGVDFTSGLNETRLGKCGTDRSLRYCQRYLVDGTVYNNNNNNNGSSSSSSTTRRVGLEMN